MGNGAHYSNACQMPRTRKSSITYPSLPSTRSRVVGHPNPKLSMERVVYSSDRCETVTDAHWQSVDEDQDVELPQTKYARNGDERRYRTKPKQRRINRLDPNLVEAIEKKLRKGRQPETSAIQQPLSPTYQDANPSLIYQALNPFYGFPFSAVRWTLSIMGTVLSILQIPIAVALSLFILYLVWHAFLVPSIPNICWIPGLSSVEILCGQAPVPPPPRISPAIRDALEYSSKLEQMQTLGADSVALPYYLRIAEGGIRGMIVQLSAVDIPTKEKLMPMLRDYSDLADRSIDGLQDWLSRLDHVVDRTILINTWAENSLQRIETRDASLMAPVNNVINKVFGSSFGLMTTEDEVRKAFFQLTNEAQAQASKVVMEAQRQRGTLVELKAILDSIAIAALGDKELLRRDKLREHSYWKWIFREHREKMSDFNAKMDMCAAFYSHTEQALTVVSTTQLKLQQMQGQLRVFRDSLMDVQLSLESGNTISLRLYIDSLKAGVNRLEESRRSTKLLKAQKMRELEEGVLKP